MEAKCRQTLLGAGKPATFPVSGLCFASLFFTCCPFFPACLCSWLNVASQQLLSVHMSPSPKHRERFTHLVSILNYWEKEPERHSLHQMTNLDFPKISFYSRALCGVNCTYLAWLYIVTFSIMGLFSKYIFFSWLHCVCQRVWHLLWDPGTPTEVLETSSVGE